MTDRCYRQDVVTAGRSESVCLCFYLLWRKKQSEEMESDGSEGDDDEGYDDEGYDDDNEDNTRNHLDILRERHKFKHAPCEGDVYDSSIYTSSNGHSCHFQIRPKSPFGSTPGPSRVSDAPNMLDIATAKSRRVPVPTSIKPSESQTVAFGLLGGLRRSALLGPSVTPGWRASDQSPPTSAAGTLRQGILQEFVGID